MTKINRWWRFGFPVIAGLSLGTAALADFFFYDQFVGWTLGGFVAWLLALFLVRNGRAVLTGARARWGWPLVVLLLGLCGSLVLEPGLIAAILSLIILGTLAILVHGWPGRALGWAWLWQVISAWGAALIRPVRDSRLVRRWTGRAKTIGSHAIGAAKWAWAFAGIVIPLALSLVFLGLFSLANPVVSDWMGRGSDKLNDFLTNLTDYITVGRVVLWYLAVVACWSLLRHRPRRQLKFRSARSAWQSITPTGDATDASTSSHPVQTFAAAKREGGQEEADSEAVPEAGTQAPDFAVADDPSPRADLFAWLVGKYTNLIVRCLIAMNLVFALQLVLDSRYLVLNLPLPDGMTYAEYAHRGAYPLIVTAILAAALVLAVFRPGGIAQRSKLAVYLVIAWIAQNILLVISAAWRLQAYVEVYTLTRLRVAAGVWMLMVAGCLALLLWRIARARDNAWLTGWAMGWGIAVLWVCSFVPFDPMIANYNVKNSQELGGNAGPIDIAYLEQLGPDALPAVRYLIDNLPEEAAQTPPKRVPSQSWERRGARVEAVDDDYAESVVEDHVRVRVESLGDQLQAVHGRLHDRLNEQTDNWRGWTVRRSWLKSEALYVD